MAMEDDTNKNMVDPISGQNPDFGFAFNNSKFSDRVLRIEIVQPETEGYKTLAELPVRRSKRSRSGNDEAANTGDKNLSRDPSRVLRVKMLHVSSVILAAKSPFFFKLFSNGMMESEQRHVTLRINNFEEAAFMEVLSFMYSNTLTSKTTPALLDVFRVADKYEVASCMTQCSQSLRNHPMTTDDALLYLSLPSSALMSDAAKNLIDAAKQFLVVRYKDILKCQDEVMNLSLPGIEAILSSDSLSVPTEDDVYDFALKWTKAHYQEPKERMEILSTHLGPKIRFPHMTWLTLRKFLTCNDFDREFATKSVLDALCFKCEGSLQQTSINHGLIQRAYAHRPIKIVELEHPHHEYVVYFDIKREECVNLFPSGKIRSRDFYVMGQPFYLSACCNMDQLNSRCFGFYLGMDKKGSGTYDIELEFSVRSKPTAKYVSKSELKYTFTEGVLRGFRNLLSTPWHSFMAEDCIYFINGVLHLRVELTVENQSV